MKSFLKNELSGWKKWDVIWLVIATVIILGVSLYFKEDAVGIFCALTGVWCVILTGKGKLSSYIFIFNREDDRVQCFVIQFANITNRITHFVGDLFEGLEFDVI